MHILYFHQHFSTPKGAAGTRSYEMALALLSQNHKVTMVCGSYGAGKTGLEQPFVKGKREGNVDGIHIIEFDLSYSNHDSFVKRALIFIKFSLASVKLALKQDYDIAFATTTPLTAGIPGIVARWLRRKTFVFEVRDLWPELPRKMGVIKNPIILWALGILEWVSYHSAHRCIALSPGITKGIEKRGIKKEKITMIPNGSDIELFSNPAKSSWRPKGVGKDDLMAIFTGTHGQANGLSSVLDAASILKERGRNNIKLVLVGDGKLKPDLQKRVKEEQLTNVIFNDPVAKEKLVGLMASADIGLQCLANIPAFYYGTSPNKFFDYIAAGLPVLNNYPGWLADMIVEQNCGWATKPDNPIAFANALEDANDNRKSIKTKGENAFLLATEKFNRVDLAKKWVKYVTKRNVN